MAESHKHNVEWKKSTYKNALYVIQIEKKKNWSRY